MREDVGMELAKPIGDDVSPEAAIYETLCGRIGFEERFEADGRFDLGKAQSVVIG